MKVFKVDLKKGKKQQNGSAYTTRLKVDYGVPYMRTNSDVSSQNVATRTGLTKPKVKERKIKEAQKFSKDLKSYGQEIEARDLAMSQKVWEIN